MDDVAAASGEVQTTGLGRVRIVRSDWTIVDGAEGTRMARRLASLLLHDTRDGCAPPSVRPGD
jgi:hypothetical protein